MCFYVLPAQAVFGSSGLLLLQLYSHVPLCFWDLLVNGSPDPWMVMEVFIAKCLTFLGLHSWFGAYESLGVLVEVVVPGHDRSPTRCRAERQTSSAASHSPSLTCREAERITVGVVAL